MSTRRHFIRGTLAGLAGASALDACPVDAADVPAGTEPPELIAQAPSLPRTGSDVGSLYPFIRSQAVRGEFPLSYLRDEFRDVAKWKSRARGKFLELLHYAPAPCDPNAEVIERVEADGYTREKVLFNTTPDLRIPA
ncbi:MAG: hypothetical protein ACLQGP_28250 [Isosphaeraceae bacterium]